MTTETKTRRTSGIPRFLWNLGFVTIGVAIATGLAWPVYQSTRMIVVAAVGAVLAVGLALIARKLAWRWWVTALAGTVLYVLTVVPLAIPVAVGSPQRMLRGVLDGLTGVVVGWKQLLTLTLPLGEYQGVLVPFFVTIFVGTLAAAALAFGNRRSSALAVAVVLLMCTFGPVFGSSTTDPPLTIAELVIPAPRQVLLGIAFILLCLSWLVGRARMARSSALRNAKALTTDVRQVSHSSMWMRLRRRAFAVILVVVSLVAGLVVAPAAAGWTPREALRDRIDPVVVVLKQQSPLSDYRTWFTQDSFDKEIFSIKGDLTGLDRVRIATLGYFDGTVFRPGSRTGEQQYRRLPTAQGSGIPLNITIGAGFSGVWLPTPGLVNSTPVFAGSFAEELANGSYVSSAGESTVVVAPRDGGGYGVRPGDSYHITVVPDTSREVAGTSRGGESLISDDDYPALASWVEQQEVPRTAAGVVELITRLRDRGYLSHSLQDNDQSAKWISQLTAAEYVFQPSYAGHSTARVEELFTALYDQERAVGADADPENLVAAIGDDEQFATAGALLARFLGFDSRVVVGTKLVTTVKDPSVEPCSGGICRGGNVTAWVEFRATGASWVTVDATPQYVVSPYRLNPGEERPKNPTVAQDTTTEVLDPPPAQRDDSTAANAENPATAGWVDALLSVLKIVGTGVLSLLLLLLPILFLLILKVVRQRRRRSAPDPEVSLVGAWDELMDLYIDYGVNLPAHATRDHMATLIGRPRAATLAVMIDAAVFAEHAPAREASEHAWALIRLERAELASESTFSTRMKAAFALRSFVRYLPERTGRAMGISLFRPREIV